MSLQKLCYENIADSIQQAPPQLQEMIIGETTDIIRKRMMEEARREVRLEVEEKRKISVIAHVACMFDVFVPEIVNDILQATRTGRSRVNFRTRYWDEDQQIVEAAISTAESISTNYLNRISCGNMSLSEKWGYDMESNSEGDY